MPSVTFSRNRAALLVLLVLFVSLCATGLWQFSVWVKSNEIHKLQQRVDSDVRRYATTLKNEIEKFQSLPPLLATNDGLSRFLTSEKNAQQTEALNRYFEQVAAITGASDIYLMDAEATTVAASNWYSSSTFIGRNFSYRPYFTEAITGHQGRYFALGTTSRKRGYYFSHPVYNDIGIIGVVVVKIDLNDIEEQWSDPILDLLVTDDDGVIFISTLPEWKFHSIKKLSPSDLERIKNSKRYPDQQLSSIALIEQESINSTSTLASLKHPKEQTHFDYLMINQPMPETDLHIVALAKLTEVDATVRSYLVSAIGLLALVLLLTAYLIQKQRITAERIKFRQQSTAALAANEAKVRAILDNTQAGLITLDEEGIIETINPTAAKLLGYPHDELIGQRFVQLICNSKHHYFAMAQAESTLEFDQPFLIETDVFRKDGSSFPIEISISELSFQNQEKRILTLHDIQERKEYEEHLRQARDELEARVSDRTKDLTRINEKLKIEVTEHQHTQQELIQAAKLAVLGQLAAGINHELNQPLTAIRAYAENSQRFLQKGDTATTQNNLSEITQLTKHMSSIISPLKVFSRKSAGEAKNVNLKAVHDGAMSILYARLEEANIVINWPDNLDGITVIGEVVWLEQVFVNILSNAIDATVESDDKNIDISYRTEANKIFIAFRDRGPGIPEGQFEQIFEPFYTSKPLNQQGLGLGLSISQRIVENLDGKLSATNHPEVGAIFILELKTA